MRAPLLVGLSLVAIAWAAEAAPSNKSCLVCHQPPLFDPDALPKSVHAKLDCADCHKGYDFHLHRAKPPEWKPAEKELMSKVASRSTAPAAIVSCTKCHEAQKDDWLGSVHGKWVKEKRPAEGPACLECHGNPHAITKSDAKNPQVTLAQRKA